MKRDYDDEDIENLINDIENNHMLKAPLNLKKDIMNTIKLEEIKKKKQKDDVTLTFYSIKVAISVAAAIFMLFALPDSNYENQSSNTKFTDGLDKVTTHIENCIEIITPSVDNYKDKGYKNNDYRDDNQKNNNNKNNH